MSSTVLTNIQENIRRKKSKYYPFCLSDRFLSLAQKLRFDAFEQSAQTIKCTSSFWPVTLSCFSQVKRCESEVLSLLTYPTCILLLIYSLFSESLECGRGIRSIIGECALLHTSSLLCAWTPHFIYVKRQLMDIRVDSRATLRHRGTWSPSVSLKGRTEPAQPRLPRDPIPFW